MSFADELEKLQRTRRAFLRFAQDLNPEGPWSGETDRRYGRTPDHRGDVPVIGTAESLGVFTNALANHEFPIEIPSIRAALADPDNEWRALADRPSDKLLGRRVSFHVRQHDDNDEILDQLIAIGQIASPTFPPGAVNLNMSIPGGDFLGEDVGRRLLTVHDWPRSLPDHRGRVIPFVYGSLSNSVPQVTVITTETQIPGESTCNCTDAQPGAETFSFPVPTNAQAFSGPEKVTDPSSGGYGWGFPGHLSGQPGSDAHYPWQHNLTLRTLGGFRIDEAAGPGSVNIFSPDYLNTDFNTNLRASGGDIRVTFAPRGTTTLSGYPNVMTWGGIPGATGRFQYDFKIDSNFVAWLIANGYGPASSSGSQPMVNILSEAGGLTGGGGLNIQVHYGPFNQGAGLIGNELHFDCYSFGTSISGSGTGRRVALPTDIWLRLVLDWKCSTRSNGSWLNDGCLRCTVTPVNGGTTVVLQDLQCVTLVLNNQQIVGSQDIIPWPNPGYTEAAADYNYITRFHVHGNASGGPVTNFRLLTNTIGTVITETETTIVTETEQVECAESDGVNDLGSAGRGGWLKALLVDTGGGVVGLSDYPVPSLNAVLQAQPHAAPTLAGSAQVGGTSVPGTYYYAMVTLHNGVRSELSNVVAVTVDETDEKVVLTWSGLASGATAVDIYRGQDANFQQFVEYRLPLSPGAGGVTDFYPGYWDRNPPPDGGDTFWESRYRQQKYYSISALYADGAESACSGQVSVGLTPRNSPLTVRLTWGAVSGGPAEVVGYRVRRANQTYHYDIVPDRQWDFGPATLTFDDPNTDTSPAAACAVQAPVGGNKPTYCLAGHTLKAVREVFVFKPDPASETNEFVWVKMTEGTDYTQEVIEVNGNRYHCLVFNEQQRSETCQYYEVTANVDGVESNADGSGTLLTNLDDIVEHILLNIIFNTYRSSVGQYAPTGGKYFEDVEWSPGLLDRASIVAAKAVGVSRLSPLGYQGAGALVEKINARQLIHDLLVSGDLDFYQHNGIWHLKRFDGPNVVRASLPHFTPADGVFKATFEPTIDQSKQVNLIPFFGGPIGGDGAQGYLVSGELKDDASIDTYRRIIISEPVYLIWTQDAATATNVIWHYLQRLRWPVIGASFLAPIRWFTLPPGAEVLVTHPDGLGAAGWVGKACRILANDLDFDRLACQITVRDVDDLVST